jgi:hypothetical protein
MARFSPPEVHYFGPERAWSEWGVDLRENGGVTIPAPMVDASFKSRRSW